MKIFITLLETGNVALQIRASDKEGNIGDLSETVEPGESFLGVSYEDFVKHGDGEMEIKEEE